MQILRACPFVFLCSRRVLRQGFTLIEMVVAVGLMMLLLGSTIVGYRQFANRQEVIQGGKEFVSALRLAQKRASVGDKPDVAGCNAGERLSGYRVRAANGADTYIVAALCDETEVGGATQIYSFAGDVVFKQAVDIRFYVLSRGVEFGAGGDNATFVVGNPQAPGYTYSVEVTRSGEIYEQGIASF